MKGRRCWSGADFRRPRLGAPDGQRCGITDRVAAIEPACAIDQQIVWTHGRVYWQGKTGPRRAARGAEVRQSGSPPRIWHVAHGANSTARAPATKPTRWERGAT